MPAERPSRLAAATLAVHLGRPAAVPGAPVNSPVVLSSTYRTGGERLYGREGNETWEALEEAVGGLEGGAAVAFASGMGAIAAVFSALGTPGRVVVAEDAYNGTRRHLVDAAERGRLRYRTVDTADTDAALRACEELTASPGRPSGRDGEFGAGGLLWLESPTNPLLRVADIAALADGAHRLGLDVVVDNTFATPLLQRPLELGADVVVHSGTKFLSGHSDVLLGLAVTNRPDVLELLRRGRSLQGSILGPWEAWVALRGVRTLSVRLERSVASAGELARRLRRHPGVQQVRYPGLEDDPGHDRARRQMQGFGAVLAFEVHGGAAAADALIARLSLITAGTSLGGVESLIERRARLVGEEAIPPALIRLSVGIEDLEDLWGDLREALDAAAHDAAGRGAVGHAPATTSTTSPSSVTPPR